MGVMVPMFSQTLLVVLPGPLEKAAVVAGKVVAETPLALGAMIILLASIEVPVFFPQLTSTLYVGPTKRVGVTEKAVVGWAVLEKRLLVAEQPGAVL